MIRLSSFTEQRNKLETSVRKTPLGNRDLMRAMNRSHVLNIIVSNGSIARADVARQSGLSPATVTGITAELIAEGLVVEKENGDSSGGRPPILLRINPGGAYVAGIKLTETKIIGALTDLEANMLAQRERPLSTQSASHVIAGMAELVQELMASADRPQGKLLGVGIGLAGVVDSQRGILRVSPYYSWRDLPIRELFNQHLNVPVYVDNDVNTLTQAEKWFGAGQNIDDFLVVTVGRGIGMGMVLRGQFYRGAGGGAGELGHTVVVPGGRECECGRHGCIETYVSEPGMVRTAHEAAEQGRLTSVRSFDELLALATEGNPAEGNKEALRILGEAGTLMGQAVANLVNLLNPAAVIIGGEGVRIGDPYFVPMQEAIRANSYAPLYGDLKLHVTPWGDDAWARGAASLVLSELFLSPLHRQGSVRLT